MRFGYGLITCQRYPGDPATDADRYAEALDLAALAETLGFDSVWTSEHHFADDAYMPSLLPVSAAIAARTTSIEIGTGLVLAPLYPPLRLAEDAATVDLLSRGRFVLGLGLGWLDWEFEALGASLATRGADLETVITTCKQGWGEGLVEAQGVSITPKPHRTGGPPIWIGAHAQAAVRRAARMADGWIAGEPTEDDFTQGVTWIRDELARSTRDADAFEIAGYWPVFVSADGADAAWEQVRPYLHYMEWKYGDAEGAKGRLGELPLPPPLDAAGEAEMREAIICGSPAEVTEKIGRLREAAGSRFTFIGRHYFPGMDRAVMREATELFASEVIPALR